MTHRRILYFVLFAATQLLQAFLFNNLTLSVWFNPLIYVAFVALLPLETPHGLVLLGGLAAGFAADWFMGGAGINTIATVFAAFVRPFLLELLFEKENIREGGIPSSERLGRWGFLRYLAVFVLLHHFVFFALEALSWARFGQTLLRVAVSGTAAVALTWLAARLFTSKLTVRV